MSDERGAPRGVTLDDFTGEPTRNPSHWRWLWEGDHTFPIRSHRGWLGRLLVAVKRLLRPAVKVPQNDLWERQRVFNLILLEWLQELRDRRLEERIGHLESWVPERLAELLSHNDALYARLDQKLDLYRRQAEDLTASLGSALAAVEGAAAGASEAAGAGPETAPLLRAWEERGYLELERRFRGTEEEIARRLEVYRPHLADRSPVLDLGCGRGEALALFASWGLAARGVDTSAAMVTHCRQRGLEAQEGDLFGHLAGAEPESLGAVVSFHVVEHLPPESLDRLVRLAWRALRPGGALVLETPNPLSLVVAARSFWLDPTHRRPIHPEALELTFRLTGFEPVERLELRPFPPASRLPEVDLAGLPEAQRPLAHQVNLLRDRLDTLLFGYQDYALVGEKPRH